MFHALKRFVHLKKAIHQEIQESSLIQDEATH